MEKYSVKIKSSPFMCYTEGLNSQHSLRQCITDKIKFDIKPNICFQLNKENTILGR